MSGLLIGLAGRARSGKDTVAERLSAGYGLQRLALADPIKDAVAAMLGVERVVLDAYPKEMEIADLGASPRKLFQTLGTEWGRETIGRDMWLTLIGRRWRHVIRQPHFSGVVITDVRMSNEVAWVRNNGGVIIHVEREARDQVRPHVSELPLPVLNGDFRLSNNGTLDELYQRVDDLMKLVVRVQAAGRSPKVSM